MPIVVMIGATTERTGSEGALLYQKDEVLAAHLLRAFGRGESCELHCADMLDVHVNREPAVDAGLHIGGIAKIVSRKSRSRIRRTQPSPDRLRFRIRCVRVTADS